MPPFPPPQSPISLNHPYLSLPSPLLLFHFRDSLSFGQHGVIVASARGGEPNAIITPRAIINSVSDGDGRRRTVDCYGVLGDHIGGLCLFSGSPHSPVKLFCRRSHCQPHSAEDCRKGNTILLERIWSSCCLLKGFQMCSCQIVLAYSKRRIHTVLIFSHAMGLVRGIPRLLTFHLSVVIFTH